MVNIELDGMGKDILVEEIAKIVVKYRKEECVDGITMIMYENSDKDIKIDISIISDTMKNISDNLKIHKKMYYGVDDRYEQNYKTLCIKIQTCNQKLSNINLDMNNSTEIDACVDLYNSIILFDRCGKLKKLEYDVNKNFEEKGVEPIYRNRIKKELGINIDDIEKYEKVLK